jgi:hypothetical protein
MTPMTAASPLPTATTTLTHVSHLHQRHTHLHLPPVHPSRDATIRGGMTAIPSRLVGKTATTLTAADALHVTNWRIALRLTLTPDHHLHHKRISILWTPETTLAWMISMMMRLTGIHVSLTSTRDATKSGESPLHTLPSLTPKTKEKERKLFFYFVVVVKMVIFK